MKSSKFVFVTCTLLVLLIATVSPAMAAPTLQEGTISGKVTALACQTDPLTAEKTFLVTVETSDGTSQTVRLSQQTAVSLGLVTVDENGLADCSEEALTQALGLTLQIDPATVLPDKELTQHPVGAALATFFSDLATYDAIMEAHTNGNGFGVIAQALWMAQTLDGDADVFTAILEAKETGDYSAFILEDGSTPTNWGQFRKAVLEGDKKVNLGNIMKDKDKAEAGSSNGNSQGNSNNQNSGNGQGNGNSSNNGNSEDNSNKNKDKEKDKSK